MTSHGELFQPEVAPVEPLGVGPVDLTRIGVIVPHDMVLDEELWRWVPGLASLHFTRTPYSPLAMTLEKAFLMSETAEIAQSTWDLISAEPTVCVYACTAGSFVGGLEGEKRITEAIRAVGVPHAVTTAGAILDALEYVGISRVSLATPYTEEVTAKFGAFLAEAGIGVVKSNYLNLVEGIWSVPYAHVRALIEEVDSPDAEAIVVSCTNLPTYDVIAEMEQTLGKVVISANQATIWSALRTVGKKPFGEGQGLFNDPELPLAEGA